MRVSKAVDEAESWDPEAMGSRSHVKHPVPLDPLKQESTNQNYTSP